MGTFGELVRARRKELRLGLREFAQRADLDPGNLSKIERGRLNPPQDSDVLDRICLALEWEPGSEQAAALRDSAAIDAGKIPPDLLDDEALAAKIPLFLRTVKNKQLTEEQMERLIQIIRET
ncbi:MAG TPA: helix-turn-helix transcriptional regulator [Longimicrobiales bacterium]|nr:helix-turn-helix transcriptional regulator [Longimicrobiales bacterium]